MTEPKSEALSSEDIAKTYDLMQEAKALKADMARNDFLNVDIRPTYKGDEFTLKWQDSVGYTYGPYEGNLEYLRSMVAEQLVK